MVENQKQKIKFVNFQLMSVIILLSIPNIISTADGFFGFTSNGSANNTTKQSDNNEANKSEEAKGVFTKVTNTAGKVASYITHYGHYDDGNISENVEYNTSDAKPTFQLPGKDAFMKVGRALYLIPYKKETDGLDTNTTFFSGYVSSFKSYLRAIYPGTQWCGDGDRARNFDDLGRFEKTDKCCRSHDICPVSIAAKETKFELKNTGLFTRSLCKCDEEFHKCLETSNTLISKKIRFTYFTVLGPQCFKEEFPIIGCIQYTKGKCIQYHLNKTEEKKYQWFDNPPY